MTDYDFPPLMTVREAARALRCSENSIRRAIRAGRIPAFQLAAAGQLKISVRALEALIAPDVMPPPVASPDADLVAEIREARGSGWGTAAARG
jgi:excisionase family DNA binding protein